MTRGCKLGGCWWQAGSSCASVADRHAMLVNMPCHASLILRVLSMKSL